MIRSIYFLLLLVLPTVTHAATRYWIGSGGNWNSTSNWSISSGGTGGASVPTTSDDVIFDGNSGNCTVNINSTIAGLIVLRAYPGLISLGSRTLTVSGTSQVSLAGNGGKRIEGTTGSLSITTSGGIDFRFIILDVDVVLNLTGSIDSDVFNTTFSQDLTATLSSSGDLDLAGLSSSTSVTVSGTADFTMASGSSGDLSIAEQGSCTFTTLNVTNSSASAGDVFLAENSTSLVTVSGTTTVLIDATSSGSSVYLGYSGDCTFKDLDVMLSSPAMADLDIAFNSTSLVTATGEAQVILNSTASSIVQVNIGHQGDCSFKDLIATCNSSGGADMYIARSTTSNVTVSGVLTANNSSTNANSLLTLGSTGDLTLNDLKVTNSSSGGSNILLATSTSSTISVSGSATISNTSTSSGGFIYVGSSGNCTFSDSLTVLNSSRGQTYIAQGGTSNVTVSGVTTVTNSGSTANVYLCSDGICSLNQLIALNEATSGGDINLSNSSGAALTVSGTATLTNNASSSVSHINVGTSGNCTFNTLNLTNNNNSGGDIGMANGASSVVTVNGVATITNNSTSSGSVIEGGGGRLDYNSTVNYIKNSSGLILPAKATNGTTYAGNVNITTGLFLTFDNATFDGTAAQSITSNYNLIFFNNLTMNSSGTGLTINNPVRVSSVLTLTDGVIHTTASDVLFMRDNSTTSGGSVASFVNGPMEKEGNDAFTFPVGTTTNGTFYAPLSISAPSSTFSRFSAEYVHTAPVDDGYDHFMVESGLHHASDREYWNVEQLAGSSSIDVGVSWDVSRSGGVDDYTDLKVAQWSGTAWQNKGGSPIGNNTTGTVEATVSTSTFSSTMPFTLASTTAQNPLPVELLYFDGEIQGDQVVLSWETASEIDNDYFVLERMNESGAWNEITRVKGMGTVTSSSEYEFLDRNIQRSENLYYRLKQVDFNGHYQYSNTILVQSEIVLKASIADITVFPQPTNGRFNVILENEYLEFPVYLKLYDSFGRVMQEERFGASVRNQIQANWEGIPSGLYWLQFENRQGRRAVVNLLIQ